MIAYSKLGRKEKNQMQKTEVISIIGGADGPTSIFIAGKSLKKLPFKERIRRFAYRCRRKRMEKRIYVNPHTLKETAAYAHKQYHAVEISKTQRKYTEQYLSAKEGLILMYKPELLGDFGKIEKPDVLNEESAKELYRQFQLRSEMITHIPDSEMPMDFHIYEIRIENGWMEFEIDFIWDIFEVSYSGNKKTMKKLKKIAQDLYLYYGVSEEDIKNKTKRYSALLAALSSK